MNLIKIILGLLLLIAMPAFSFCQVVPGQKFVVVSLPRKAGYPKEELNKDLNYATDRKQVIKIIKSNPKLNNIYIVLQTVNKAGENVWLPVNSPDKKEEETQWILLQSKDIVSNKFYNLNDIRVNLSDSVFVLDTLSVGFYMHGNQYDNNGFFLNYDCGSNSTPAKLSLSPGAGNAVSLTKNSFNCESAAIRVRLFNTAAPDRQLTQACLIFADDEAHETLKEMATFLKIKDPSLNAKDIAAAMQGLIRAHFGKVNFAALTAWISHQLNPN